MKGQATFETIIAIGLLLIILVFSYTINSSKNSETKFTSTYLEAQKICYKIKNSINQVHSDGLGTVTRIDMPTKIDTSSYNITVNSTNQIVTINWENNSFSCVILTANVTNSTGHGSFSLNQSNKIIKNTDGVVIIENA